MSKKWAMKIGSCLLPGLFATCMMGSACSGKVDVTPPGSTQGQGVTIGYDGEVSPDGAPAPWVIRKKTGTPQVRVVTPPERKGERVVYLKCTNSSFSLNREVSIGVKQFGRLTWAWKAEQLPTSAKVDPEGSKDQVLQLFLYFDGGKVISYHWDTARPKGTTYDDSIPFLVKIKVVVVESGEDRVGKWTEVARDVYADSKDLYGGAEPPTLKAIRIQSNSQYTKSTGSGYVGKLTFGPSEGGQPGVR